MKDNNQKLAIYLRASSDNENHNKKRVLEQKNAGIQIARELNMNYDVFIDKYKSKPMLLEAFAACETGKYYGIYTHDISRISRNAIELTNINKFLFKHSVKLLIGSSFETKPNFETGDSFVSQIMRVIKTYEANLKIKKNENKKNSNAKI